MPETALQFFPGMGVVVRNRHETAKSTIANGRSTGDKEEEL
jgi:hypothetical protein